MIRNFLLLAFVFLIYSALPLMASNLTVARSQKSDMSSVTATISVDDAPKTVKAFAMDVRYDASVMTFTSYERGSLGADGYPMFKVTEYAPGVIRIGGVDAYANGILEGQTGDLVHLSFRPKGQAVGSVEFGALNSDMRGWTRSADPAVQIEEVNPASARKNDEQEEEEDSQYAYEQEATGSSQPVKTGGDSNLIQDISDSDATTLGNENLRATNVTGKATVSGLGLGSYSSKEMKTGTETRSRSAGGSSQTANHSFEEPGKQAGDDGVLTNVATGKKPGTPRMPGATLSGSHIPRNNINSSEVAKGVNGNRGNSLTIGESSQPGVETLLVVLIVIVFTLGIAMFAMLFVLVLIYKKLKILENRQFLEQ